MCFKDCSSLFLFLLLNCLTLFETGIKIQQIHKNILKTITIRLLIFLSCLIFIIGRDRSNIVLQNLYFIVSISFVTIALNFTNVELIHFCFNKVFIAISTLYYILDSFRYIEVNTVNEHMQIRQRSRFNHINFMTMYS